MNDKINDIKSLPQVKKRLEKALEVKRGLMNLNIDDSFCGDFPMKLNDWVKNGTSYTGKIKIPEIGKKIVYQLLRPDYTVVKLTDL